MKELRGKINDIILSYCGGFYHLEFTEDDLPNILDEIEEAINYSRCCKSDSEQLVLFADWLQYNGKWSTTEQQVKDFLKEQQEQN